MNQIAWHMYVIVYLKVDDAIIYQWGSGHFDEDIDICMWNTMNFDLLW